MSWILPLFAFFLPEPEVVPPFTVDRARLLDNSTIMDHYNPDVPATSQSYHIPGCCS